MDLYKSKYVEDLVVLFARHKLAARKIRPSLI